MSKGVPFSTEQMPYAALFNEYFGSGLSSIVFQEIREGKALAYSAYAAYTTPGKKEDAHYVRAYVGTQNNKLSDAVSAILALMNDMPADQKMFDGSKDAALKNIESQRTTKEAIFWSYDAALRRGLDHDINKDLYAKIPSITLADMKNFFDTNIKGRHYTYLSIGKESAMDMKALEKLGPVRKLTHEGALRLRRPPGSRPIEREAASQGSPLCVVGLARLNGPRPPARASSRPRPGREPVLAGRQRAHVHVQGIAGAENPPVRTARPVMSSSCAGSARSQTPRAR